jgi:hypothetical protein
MDPEVVADAVPVVTVTSPDAVPAPVDNAMLPVAVRTLLGVAMSIVPVLTPELPCACEPEAITTAPPLPD